MKRKGFAVGIILLFVVSTIAPMAIGFTTHSTEKYNRYDFDSYHSSAVYNIEEQTRRNPILDTVTSDVSISHEEITSPSNVLGPMDSAWPMYCHDVRHTGQSPYSTINTTGDEKWQYKFNYGVYGSVAISKDGTIYFGCNDLYFYNLYPNGTVKWRYYVGCTIQSCPAIDENGIVYVGMSIPWNGLYAFYSNGTIKWRYDAGSIISSPAIGTDGVIYFGTQDGGNPPTGAINALYPNGTLKWTYPTSHIIYSSPALGNDGIVYCGSHDNFLYALYSNNGTLKWKFPTGDWIRASPCIGEDGTIYCVSLDNYLYAVYPNGTMKWRTNVGAGTSPTIGRDGTIYAGYNYLYAINPINGSIKWTFNPGSGSTIRGGTPCNSVDGTIYFGTYDGGYIYAVNPDGSEKWKRVIGRCDSAPAIGEDGTVYLGTSNEDGGYLHAFGPGEPKKIEIQQPEFGKRYLLGMGLGNTLSGNTLIIGSVKVKVHVYSEDEIISVHFYVDGTDQYFVTKPPYEWNMNHRFGDLFPLKHTITVTGYYEGGISWSESIDVMYFHLLKN